MAVTKVWLMGYQFMAAIQLASDFKFMKSFKDFFLSTPLNIYYLFF